ncbi:uncharacterized protein F5891DRAFT_1170945 [Suillus fuscotomentosus]|uniref:Ubiquitin-like domain-containing protein n=1 Tax=Suillus fuscotomentosus TaxID=1912939 RepID=A0AAD4HQX4_9AGAM|nr:uncharacterized protein F5891DRAFT_1170945 [Suillus fuscotomentosus]KAG1904259.1 hypothetical protein F5891DRAFT_1170945 [Suillus fuscotomentosus]
MPSLSALIKVFFKDLDLLKGIAVRSRCPATCSGDSFARTPSDMAQIISPIVQATIAGAIPVAGPPIQATISGLLSILQAIYIRSQNKADIDRLRAQLQRLSSHLCNAPTAQDPFEQHRRDAMIRMLQDIYAKVTRLYNHGLAYTSVTQAIIECSSEIDHYFADYSWSSQMQSEHEILMRFGSVFFPVQSPVGPIVTLGFVTLVDATGRLHPIPMDVCDSFERFNEQLQLLFKHNSTQAQIQRRYMKQRQYDLCIDDDKQVTQLASRRWPSIQAGTTIVMRVIFQQKTRLGVEYTCHFCGAVNHISRPKNLLQRQAGCSIDCRVCKRRFQISQQDCATQPSIDSVPRTEEMSLIRNFHVQKTWVCRLRRLPKADALPHPALRQMYTSSKGSNERDKSKTTRWSLLK